MWMTSTRVPCCGHPWLVAARIPLPPNLRTTPFTARHGAAAGLSPDRLRGSDLHRPFHGVRSANGAASILDRCKTFQEWMPPHAFFCSVTAALIMRVPLPLHLEESRLLHVAVPAPQHPPESKGVVGHRLSVTGDYLRAWGGLRISSPEQVWCELGSVLSLADLIAAGDFLIHRQLPFTTQQRLRDAVAAFPGRRGKPTMRCAVELLNERAESRKESLLRVIIVQAGLPGLSVNLPITTSGGFDYRADLAFPERKVVIEYQGGYHGDEAQRRKDMTRRSRLEADGWFVMEVNADDLKNPTELLHRIRRVLVGRPIFA